MFFINWFSKQRGLLFKNRITEFKKYLSDIPEETDKFSYVKIFTTQEYIST